MKKLLFTGLFAAICTPQMMAMSQKACKSVLTKYIASGAIFGGVAYGSYLMIQRETVQTSDVIMAASVGIGAYLGRKLFYKQPAGLFLRLHNATSVLEKSTLLPLVKKHSPSISEPFSLDSSSVKNFYGEVEKFYQIKELPLMGCFEGLNELDGVCDEVLSLANALQEYAKRDNEKSDETLTALIKSIHDQKNIIELGRLALKKHPNWYKEIEANKLTNIERDAASAKRSAEFASTMSTIAAINSTFKK